MEMKLAMVAFLTISFLCFLISALLLIKRVKALCHSGKRTLFVEFIGIGCLITGLLFIISSLFLIPMQSTNRIIYCRTAIWSFIWLYFSSSLFVYLFLIEKAHIVHCAFFSFEKRSVSKLYKSNIGILSLYMVILIVVILNRNSELQGNICHIGIKEVGAISFLLFDVTYRIYLSSLFFYPMIKFANESTIVMDLTWKNMIGTFISTIFSFLNIFFIYMGGGSQPGHICLFMCTMDVFVNVVIMNWLLTTHRDKNIHEIAALVKLVQQDSVVHVNVTYPPLRPSKLKDSSCGDLSMYCDTSVDELGCGNYPAVSLDFDSPIRFDMKYPRVITISKDALPASHTDDVNDTFSSSKIEDRVSKGLTLNSPVINKKLPFSTEKSQNFVQPPSEQDFLNLFGTESSATCSTPASVLQRAMSRESP
jgi:hypothetical protein